MNGYAAADPYAQPAVAADGTAWYGDGTVDATATTEQQGFSIPTTGQAGGPIRQVRGGASRFNPMGRGKPAAMAAAAAGDNTPQSAAGAEKNELGYIIFIYNIGYQTDESQIHSLFTPFGTVAKINVIQDFNTGMNKGYAFVTMPNQAEAEAAVNGLNNQPFNGNTLQVRFKSPKGAAPPAGMVAGRGGMRGGVMKGVRGAMRGAPRGAMRGAATFRGARGMVRGAAGIPRGRGRGAYSAAPSAYDGYGYTGYDQYGYPTDPAAAAAAAAVAYSAGYDYTQQAAADPYAGYAAAAAAYPPYGGAAAGW